jgi:hypothetical protein
MTGADMSRDETTIRVLLNGFVRHDKNGLPRKEYLKPDSEEELTARATLARHLRSEAQLTREQRNQLANLLDPALEPENDRRLVFQHRRRGRRPQHMANTQIARHVWDRFRSGWGAERAVEHTMSTYKLTRERVYDIWSRYRPIFEKLNEPFDQVKPNQ